MKIALFLLAVVLIMVALFYFSGILFIFFLGLQVGLLIGIIAGVYINKWFHSTSMTSWRKKKPDLSV